MNYPASSTAPPTDQQLDTLVGPICELIVLLEQAITESEELTGTKSGAMAPHQQALLSSFALLLSQLDLQEGESDGAGLRVPGKEGAISLDMQQEIGLLQQMQQRVPEIARATASLRRLLETWHAERIVHKADTWGATQQTLVHLFELLLARSNRSLRRSRGVYFTPYPLVQFVVRSIDVLLRGELGVAGGLITSRRPLRIVDPACGSGAFLLGVLQHARQVFTEERDADEWPNFVEGTLLPNLTGIDVMPACCGAAEMLIHRLLTGSTATACLSRSPLRKRDGRVWSAHCGNPLSEVDHVRELFAERVPVILGNPPYAIFGQRNRGDWILRQLDEYKRGLDEKKLNLDDDFIKFLRWAQYWIDQAGLGIVAMVTSNTYFTGLTHRQMRASLSGTFDQMYLLDLHGSSKKRETAPDGTVDENVFPIQQGVAISLLVKTGRNVARPHRVAHAELWGTCDAKLKALAHADVTTVNWTTLQPQTPFHFFVPRSDEGADDYGDWPRLSEIFQRYVSGVQTKWDALFVGHTYEEVETRMRAFLRDASVGRFAAEVPRWLRSKAAGATFDGQCIRPYMVAPLDMRWVYYEPRLLGRARHQLIRHWDAGSVALVFMRQATDRDGYDHFLVTDTLVSDRVFYSAHGAPFIAPLYLQDGGQRRANLQPGFLHDLAQRLGIPYTVADEGLPTHFGARDVLHWLYATVHSRAYRQRYHSLLGIDFPRIAWPHDAAQFVRLCQLGKMLVDTQLSVISGNRSSAAAPACERWCDQQAAGIRIGAGYPLWQEGQVALNAEFFWPDLIEADVWRFRIGGYRVLERWLKQRKQRQLLPPDLGHFEQMIQAIRSTCRIMDAIDCRSSSRSRRVNERE